MIPTPDHETDGRRRVAAGQAILVTLIALLLAALLNANSLVASIEGENFGTSRTIGLSLAKPLRTISHWTGLDLPRQLIDDLVARAGPHPHAVVAPPPPAVVPLGPLSPSAPVTATTLPPRRTPTAQHPLKVWMAGDSLMGSLAQAFTNQTANDPLLQVTNSVHIATGLARPDVYNWPNAIASEMATVNPDVVVLIFGANDDQPMVTGGQRFVLQSPAWQEEYARRVDQVLATAARDGRQVIWLGVPAMRRPRLNVTRELINTIVRTASHEFPNVSFVDTNPILDGPGGSYTPYRTSSNGNPVMVRDADGVHMTIEGADRVTPLVLADIDELWDLHR